VIQAGDKIAVNMHLSKFKDRGIVVFDKVFSIPSSERIPALAKNEETRYQLLVALSASLKSAFGNMNLKMGMNEDQIIELADCIIDQSQEDNLSLEDVLLFLQELLVGKTISENGKEGRIFDRMDIPKFFELFEVYRQKRHEEIIHTREEQNAQFKILGKDITRPPIEDDKSIDTKTFLELMQTVYEEKHENNT
jgi:hypothetical protein